MLTALLVTGLMVGGFFLTASGDHSSDNGPSYDKEVKETLTFSASEGLDATEAVARLAVAHFEKEVGGESAFVTITKEVVVDEDGSIDVSVNAVVRGDRSHESHQAARRLTERLYEAGIFASVQLDVE